MGHPDDAKAPVGRIGYALQPDGSVRELWRERSDGRWIPAPWAADADSDCFVRVEAGHVLEVEPGDDAGAFLARVDGIQVGEASTLARAQRLALGRTGSR